jgi:hypothetical protein
MIKLKNLWNITDENYGVIFFKCILVMIILMVGSLIYSRYYEQKLCSEKLGVEFHLKDEPYIFMEYIDKTHYNCCWDEVELTDDSYCTNRKCRGFEK